MEGANLWCDLETQNFVTFWLVIFAPRLHYSNNTNLRLIYCRTFLLLAKICQKKKKNSKTQIWSEYFFKSQSPSGRKKKNQISTVCSKKYGRMIKNLAKSSYRWSSLYLQLHTTDCHFGYTENPLKKILISLFVWGTTKCGCNSLVPVN
jgi:hypothetical protein